VNSSLACPPIVDYSGNLFGSPWVCWSMGSSVTVSGSNLTFDSTYGLNDNFYASCSVFVDAKNGEIIASRAGGAQIGNA
jgi:hypothetical protein